MRFVSLSDNPGIFDRFGKGFHLLIAENRGAGQSKLARQAAVSRILGGDMSAQFLQTIVSKSELR